MLKAAFWDHPDLADDAKLGAFLEDRRHANDEASLVWAMTRLLERGRAVDAMKYFPLEEIREMLPKLRLDAYARKKWDRLLDVYGRA